MSFPLVTRFGANPLLDLELANKNYVDNSGGGGVGFAKVVKTVDQSQTDNAVPIDDDELFIPLNANKIYGMILIIWGISQLVPDYRHQVSIPAGATLTANIGTWNGDQDNATIDLTSADGIAWAATAIRIIQLNFRVITAGTAGDFQYKWSQNVSDPQTTTVKAGSMLVAWESD